MLVAPSARLHGQATPEITRSVVRRLTERGISVKGYFIPGFATETRTELDTTVQHVYELWGIAERQSGRLRASVFKFRRHLGTPERTRLVASGRYAVQEAP